ncbi:beta-ketoacyl-[acyl-carrier-protein] synthase family protein [Opitutus sp. GAS368]|uniref:beta-ketoacyl-[acyl-carrier-protein] synthase family protein n=1 Tax=Opitutus sp. GAS368 TaxID=1882749 RepID=UPI00087D9298|nr:beta-ketoacyl-[acyl-carrier-protein] synthase family protein [Opitutus sp. GAS368]SDS13575.1 3-oxoacyl-[acyl-carrier-protein] synthase-1/3-oxoacyl-[acyl-carrier-protein] synthase II [Opitutus sp. GAS368]
MPPLPVITGLGFITSIGQDRLAVQRSLCELRHGFAPVEFLGNPALPVKVAGTVKGFSFPTANWRDWGWPEQFAVDRELLRGLAPHGVYAVCALQQALADAGLGAAELGDGTTGLFCASAGSPFMLHSFLNQLHETRGERGNPMGIVSSIAGTLNFNLAAHYRITGAVCGFVSACASSSHALGHAMDEIRLGRQQRMLVVGAEDLTAESIVSFASLRALSSNPDPATASRPFDRSRDGFVGTGGAVALIVEDAALARRRGAHIYAELIGWGQAGDGHSVAVSHPEGAGLRRAMQRALADARVNAADIGYVNAHATSTIAGDRSEALALHAVFTAGGARPRVSSTKALTGHGLSLAGVMEAGFCALAIEGGFIPGAAHLTDPDPVCAGLDLPRTTLAEAPGLVLNNSSGFGGSNVCHLLRRPA